MSELGWGKHGMQVPLPKITPTASIEAQNCKHLRAVVRPSSHMGNASCPDCKHDVPLWIVFNNLLEAMQRVAGVGVLTPGDPNAPEK